MFIKKFLKDMKLAIGHSLSRLSPRDELVSQGVELFFQKQRVLFVHLEFSPFCNKRCSYCCDGNGMIGGKKVSFSAENDYVGAVQKIHDIVKDDDFVCFIIAGGEAALQPSLKTVVDTIYQRNNSIAILTTNLTSSVEFYNKLNIPLICSLHLEDTDPNNFLEKVMTLNHLMAHVRIMAHPKKMELVNYAYNMFKKTPLNFAVERIMPFGDFTESYTKEEEDLLLKLSPIEGRYPGALVNKLGPCVDLFYKSLWTTKKGKRVIKEKSGSTNFKGFFCERNLLVVQSDGKLLQAWCNDPHINIFSAGALPKDIFSLVSCEHESCPMGFAGCLPKFNRFKYAPLYLK